MKHIQNEDKTFSIKTMWYEKIYNLLFGWVKTKTKRTFTDPYTVSTDLLNQGICYECGQKMTDCPFWIKIREKSL